MPCQLYHGQPHSVGPTRSAMSSESTNSRRNGGIRADDGPSMEIILPRIAVLSWLVAVSSHHPGNKMEIKGKGKEVSSAPTTTHPTGPITGTTWIADERTSCLQWQMVMLVGLIVVRVTTLWYSWADPTYLPHRTKRAAWRDSLARKLGLVRMAQLIDWTI